jgi:HEPN domain-containing protein
MTDLITISPSRLNLIGELNLANNFFDRYAESSIELKLLEAWKSKILFSAPGGNIIHVEDLTFFEDLLLLLQNFKELVMADCKNLLIPNFSEHTLVDFEGVVNLIKQAIPVGTIYNLSRTKHELDLIIVLEKKCTKAYNEFENIIDLALLSYPNGTCTVHNYGLLNTLISKGHLFYAAACIERNVIYRKDEDQVFTPVSNVSLLATKALAIDRFKIGMQRVNHFYQGAQCYFNDGMLEMAIFMLHQTCELTYRCLLNVLREKDVRCHSPAILRKHLKRFAPEIIGVFSEVEAEELAYLQVLEDAYIKARYHPDYTIDYELTAFLNERIAVLQEKASILFETKTRIIGLGLG